MGIIYMGNNITASSVEADQELDSTSTNAISNKAFCEAIDNITFPQVMQCGVKTVNAKGNGRRTFNVTFSKAFTSTPVLLCGRGDTQGERANNFSIKSISNTGFTISTFSYEDGTATYYVHWIAYGKIAEE